MVEEKSKRLRSDGGKFNVEGRGQKVEGNGQIKKSLSIVIERLFCDEKI